MLLLFVYLPNAQALSDTVDTIIRPSGVGNKTELNELWGAPTKWEAVRDASFSNYAGHSCSTCEARDTYIMDNVTSSNEINKITIYVTGWNINGDYRFGGNIRIDNIIYDTSFYDPGLGGGTYSTTYYTNPSTGLPWTVSDINNMEAGVTIHSVGGYSAAAVVTYMYIVVNYNPVPTLYLPVNMSNQIKIYPPLNTDINFTWLSGSPLNSNLLIAKDPNFNLITVDTITSNNYSVQSLEVGNYWWKVRYYNSTSMTYSNYSDIFNFTLSNQQVVTGTGIQGIVYEIINGVVSPISGATVIITNSTATWTNTQIVGNNGYFLFTGLSNSTTYQLRASRQDIYTDSSIYYVTTGLGTVTTQNIILQKCVSGFNCFYNQQYVQYTVQNLLFTKYADVTTTVYKGTDIIPQTLSCNPNNCNTGIDGIINILLIKDQYYRITFVNSSLGISVTWQGYPSKSDYLIIVPTTFTGTFTNGANILQNINISVSTSIINATHAKIFVNYSDANNQTSNLAFKLNQSILGDPYNQTLLQTISGGSNGTYNATFVVSGYTGQGYILGITANHVTFGTISNNYAAQFPISNPLSYFNVVSVLMLGIGLIFFFAGFFGQTSTEQGAAIIVGLVWILDGIGVWVGLNNITFHLALVLATVIAILMNVNARSRREGIS